MANAVPVHSSKKGKQVNEVSPQSSEVESAGPVQPSESGVPGVAGGPEGSLPEATVLPPVQLELDLGYKLESHQAYRKDN